ncbi:MAG: FAD-binding domain-containing protein [Opitutales bacterium]
MNQRTAQATLHIVWFKRDLRVADHRPLTAAIAANGPVLPLYLVEPSIVSANDFDRLHATFITRSLQELDSRLRALGAPLTILRGEAVEVFEALRERWAGPVVIHSHEETGNGLTYARDQAVRRWCRAQGARWEETPANGVVRGLTDRDRWSSQWEKRMRQPILPAPAEGSLQAAKLKLSGLARIQKYDTDAIFPDVRDDGPRAPDLLGGEETGHEILGSFLAGRGARYHREMSSPVTAYDSCSRLSPYLAWGNLSMRQVVQATRARQTALSENPDRNFPKQALRAFLSRCHWHCHFIQKLEREPRIEHHAFHPAFENVRDDLDDAEAARRLSTYEAARTGYPFVDACLRSLKMTGWINFRMRAMLVSFAAYDLWLDWRHFAPWLARQFIDYEPGIHFSQTQMQSGTTGINTLRIYSPIKQGHDHDPDAEFIARWIPELSKLPTRLRHEPWKASPLQLKEAGVTLGVTYPERVVEHAEAVRHAKSVMYALKGKPETRALSKVVYEKHGSRMGPSSRRINGNDDARFSGRGKRATKAPKKKAAPKADTRQSEMKLD